MKIEIWSDIVCPFCYIGKRKLEEALEVFPGKSEVEIEFKSFQLDPNTPPYTGQDFHESMAQKFGSVEQAKQMTVGITEQAKAVGLEMNFDTMKPANTLDAHRLTKFAKTKGKDAVISEKLFHANFIESKDTGDIDTLVEIAEAVGLDADEARTVLEDKQAYLPEVQADISEAQQLGVTSVPYFVFDRKYALAGAQPTEAFTQTLDTIWAEKEPAPAFKDLSTDSDTGSCGDDGCEV